MTDLLNKDYTEKLFRREYAKLLSVTAKLFGPYQINLAEDAVQDTLITALQNWRIQGIPDHPTAWLIKVARNKSIDIIRKQKRFSLKDESLSHLLTSEYTLTTTVNEIITDKYIDDDLLRMMFICCHPELSTESQLCLILQTLCGFSVSEIAKALVSSYESIEKKLYRAKKTWRDLKLSLEWPEANQIQSRMNAVLTAIYLLGNEGYHSTHHASLTRPDLLQESLRLNSLLISHSITNLPEVHALNALILFMNARYPGRINQDGTFVNLKNQDRSTWDTSLIEEGNKSLERAMQTKSITRFHLEAVIAQIHANSTSYIDTDWTSICTLYDTLNDLYPNHVIAINRAIAMSEKGDVLNAYTELKSIEKNSSNHPPYLLYPALADVCQKLNLKEEAIINYTSALTKSKSEIERKYFKDKISFLSMQT